MNGWMVGRTDGRMDESINQSINECKQSTLRTQISAKANPVRILARPIRKTSKI